METGSSKPALRLTVVVWGFGYLLVAIFMTLQSRASFPVAILAQMPLLIAAILMMTSARGLLVAARRRPPTIRWPLIALTVAMGTFLISAADTIWLYALAKTVTPNWASWATEMSVNRAASIALLYCWTVCLNLALFWALDVNEGARSHLARAAAAEAAAARAETTVLRLQLNPHFLFNTLNAITSLVMSRRNSEAEIMIGQLADFLRASLSSDPNSVVPLAEEIATIQAYLAIENSRFGDRMALSIEVGSGAPEACVPNFILQPLIENAVKHGVASTHEPVAIRVRAEKREGELVVAVTNERCSDTPLSGPAFPPQSSFGVGLSNVRKRLEILYGDRARLRTSPSDSGFEAVVRLPYAVC